MNNQPKVQKKNKKSKLNGMTLYAKELSGYRVRAGDENVHVSGREIERAKDSWNRLSESEKQGYKTRAKELQIKIQGNNNRFNSIGENLLDVEDKQRRVKETIEKRKNEVQMMIQDASDLGDLNKKIFYFVSTLDFYSDSNGIYPAEIAFSKFSLKEGVTDAMSIRINPGILPLGSRLEAEIRSSIHRYPLPGTNGCDGETEYLEILLKIICFLKLKPEERVPVFFTEGNPSDSTQIKVFESTTKVLKLIFDKCAEFESSDLLKIYPIDELFFYLHNEIVKVRKESDDYVNDAFSSIPFAHDKFMRSDIDFHYKPGLSCDYHDLKDASQHCCLSRVKRYGYVIAKWCCQEEEYPIKKGFHYP